MISPFTLILVGAAIVLDSLVPLGAAAAAELWLASLRIRDPE